ncbi:MAG TPA: F0F1 ATP synthase subunit delta [Chloroflexota bacterium]|nr:F0F1 ATP synthase subunit delta [Chloroflexota bacterium]
MPTSGVARRYARAVFAIASEQNDHDQWLRDLRAIRDMLNDPGVSAYLASPTVAVDAKMHACDLLMPRIGEKQRNLVNVLIQNRRIGLVSDVVAAFEEELDRSRGIVHAVVTTAIPLGVAEEANVARRLEAMTGRKVLMTSTVDPTILGGFVARIGDQLIDASIVGRLQALRASLMA